MCLSTLRIIQVLEGEKVGLEPIVIDGVIPPLLGVYNTSYIRPFIGPPCPASFSRCVRMVCSWMFLIRTNVGFFLGDEASKEGLEIDRALGGLTWIFGLGKHVFCFRSLKIWRLKVETDMMIYNL